MIKRYIYIVGGDSCYANWMQGTEVKKMEDADLVLFTGGEDVSPNLYGKKANPTTGNNPARDRYEITEFDKAKALGKPMIGICRGSQFLCVMNKGILVQNQQNKYSYHNITTDDGRVINISSTHHQAAYPFVLSADKYKILGWTNGISAFHEGETHEQELNPPKECEIVYYPEHRCLGIQGHPEYQFRYEQYVETIEYVRGLLNKHMAGQL